MKYLMTLLLATTLTGCLSMESLKESTELDTSFYRLDANSRMLCRGASNNCQDLTSIASSRHLLADIEEAYGQPVQGSSMVRGLMLLMLQPADKAYTAEPIAGKSYQYRLPITDRTDLVWGLLKQAGEDLYGTSNAQD